MAPASLGEHVTHLMTDLTAAARRHYGSRLVSVAVFGSMGRGTPRHDSDLDVLIVADGLPRGRMARVEDFAAIEADLEPRLAAGRQAGFFTDCSPVFKTPDEALAGSPLFLDMVDDARILYDVSLAQSYLRKARVRLMILGVLFDAAAYSNVVREAQEIVDLALKGMLRQAGVEPPHWHDVGDLTPQLT